MKMLQTVAAYAGLALGLINLGLLIYKDYLRRGRLTVTIRRAEVRALVFGTFDIQLDLDLSAKGGPIYIKEIVFEHSLMAVFNPSRDVKDRRISKVIDYPGHSMLDAQVEEFVKQATSLFSNSEPVVNLKLEDKQHRALTLIDRIPVERSMDGYWDWPRSGWSVSVSHSEGKTIIPMSFIVHKSNIVPAFVG
ncbi:hypothetical protein [Variovorax sp. YR216]|uniref:hypothetical protein n=1 Tax=Variovorax sp. YR216 TaxID=1882828 RepID=UPI00115F7DB6|nr:hypothetical protein [Variovorax sp. YR216]